MRKPNNPDGYDPPDLSTVPSDMLLYELGKRFDTCAFVWATSVNGQEYRYNIEMSGTGVYCLGLLEWAAATEKTRMVHSYLMQNAAATDSDEEDAD